MAHAPKDLNPTLSQFVSFCWYHPDNDMCTRGNSHIYLNTYYSADGMISNIESSLCDRVSEMLKISKSEASTEIVFYTYAILCSQVYLDAFEGALFTVNRSDKRARVPMVNDSKQFCDVCALGKKIANLEKKDFNPDNVLRFDYELICKNLKSGFKLEYSVHPFDEELELMFLRSGQDLIEIPCPVALQRLNISGYNIIKNVWLKFNSYNFTHCEFTRDDLIGLLNLLNKLAMHINLIGLLDIKVHEIIAGTYQLILPTHNNER